MPAAATGKNSSSASYSTTQWKKQAAYSSSSARAEPSAPFSPPPKWATELSASLPLSTLGIFFPFLLTAVLKTAQGSSTVAIITASSIIKPLLPALGLAAGNGPLLCVLSMGAGSMLLSHANDAYFWVITRMSGLSLRSMLRTYTPATALMGIAAYAAVYVLSRLIG
ncbi:hypothetical protein ACQ86N_19195 [Puia sp. P3]|uniref:GntT/GntP/DsdX family permease n=1 Tax=Puia sp. P3 TaxID=3423952 RepID=UPI003D67DD01